MYSRWLHGLPRWPSGKASACQCRIWGFDPWVGKIPGSLEKEIATHSSVLVWQIPWTEEAGSSKRVGHGIMTKQQHWLIEKAIKFQKNIYFCCIDYAKTFDCVDHNKLWKILQEMGKPDHLTCLLRNLHVGQETTVRTGHGATDWFKIGKGEQQDCILSPCLFNFYAEYIMQNMGLYESQTGIKISGRNISNLRYENDTTLMAEIEKKLKSLLMRVEEESEKAGLKLHI